MSGASCSANLAAPSSLSATDGTVSNGINITWGSVSGASSYLLQYRKQGTSTWSNLYSGASTSYSWTGLSDESVYEFQVLASNVLGSGSFSAIDTGFIRKLIDPKFVSQSGIPAKIGIGQSFNYTQVWRNDGSETWTTGGSYGTSPFNPSNTSVWSQGFTAFSSSTSTNGSVTTSLSATAPSTPGTYPLQRIFTKGGVEYGAASTSVSIVVMDTPKCSGVTANTTTFYNKDNTVTVTISGALANSVESAFVRVWSDANGTDDVRDYTATSQGSGNWRATVPLNNHADFGSIQIQAWVGSTVFPEVICASTSVNYVELPIPQLTLTPTLGSFTEESIQGFVVDRANGLFAKGVVNLGDAFNTLKTKIEIRNVGDVVVATVGNVTAGAESNLTTNHTSGDAWTMASGSIRVTYADTDTASQGKELIVPVRWRVAPMVMDVGLTYGERLPLVATASVSRGGSYSQESHGTFAARLERHPSGAAVAPEQTVNEGLSLFDSGLDYATLYNASLVAVMRALPPDGVTLLSAIEFRSTAVSPPALPPATVNATDGTREDDVRITWPALAPGNAFKYRVYRDGTEISDSSLGVSGTSLIDEPPERGKNYTYAVRSILGSNTSAQATEDTGFVPLCRAARLIGASLNADMSAINGLIERWDCLEGLEAMQAINAGSAQPLPLPGPGVYRGFSIPLSLSLPDGSHVLKLSLESSGVSINASRTYDVPFTLDRASITFNNLSILYNGAAAADGLTAASIGLFGIRMTGGSGIGFAEHVGDGSGSDSEIGPGEESSEGELPE
ncbi:GBS Bsp-like repeat-containing protein [Allochromatium tepidum]|uniref:GBS Bsp-like repeat-containing protein n=1 Tax=Allochromatium tepidum TaxID=553982 RepID=UPI001BD1974E|nr:GBS Bsp-like repeat-containing protein [Allochromatium tepidum]